MKPIKSIVYLPVKVEDEPIPEYTLVTVSCDGGMQFNQVKYYASHFKEDFEMVTHWLKPQESFVFTPEQLNKYTANVVRQALETAAEKAISEPFFIDGEPAYMNDRSPVNTQSITNTFEQTFKQFEV